MKRRYSWPQKHWHWPVPLTHKHGVRVGDLIFTGGQADLDAQGQVQHPDNMDRQCVSVMNYLFAVLEDLGADRSDLVKLVVYFVGDAATEKKLLGMIAELLGSDVQPVVNTVCLPQLCYPGMVLELEGVAMRTEHGGRMPRQCFHLDDMPALDAGFSHVLRCGDMIFTSDLSALMPDGTIEHAGEIAIQTQTMMDRVVDILGVVGADVRDVLKLNVYYVGDGTADDWATSAHIRAGYFKEPGPAATGISVSAFAQSGLMTKIAITAMRGADGQRLDKQFAWPDGHWNWTVPLPYKHGNRCGQIIHLGGQVSLDGAGKVVDPGDMIAQTERAMDNIGQVLNELDATIDDVVKVTTFYQGKASGDELHKNLLIRSGRFTDPGPATTGIPVEQLVYEDMLIEIEVIAIVDD